MTTRRKSLVNRSYQKKCFGQGDGTANNEEWPQIISANIGESTRMNLESKARELKKIGLKNISADDLKSMKKQDPFLYYSIPGVRRAELLQKDVDVSDLAASCMPRNAHSCPAKIQKSKAPSQSATRRSRISFECHPDLFEENEDISVTSEDDDGKNLDDPLDFLMTKLSVDD